MAVAGCLLLSVPLLVWPLGMKLASEREWMPAPPSLVLVVGVALLCALGCCGGALVLRSAVGVGLVAGWVLLGVATGGWCTGLAIEFYEPERMYQDSVDRFVSMDRPEADRAARARLRALVGARAATSKVRGGGCWVYRGRGEGLVEPLGSGVVEVSGTLPGRGQETVDRLAGELAKGRKAVGRRYEAAFEDAEGFVVELVPGEGDTGAIVTVRSPCLRDLR